MLKTSLKQQCDTRWNTVYVMLNSIESNAKEIESIVLERKKYSDYMDSIHYLLLKCVLEILSSYKPASE